MEPRMANVTPELIRDISVQAVEDFLNNKVPLSKGLAKQAAAYELNVEQVKRAVESTNNIAYLKILQHAEDRRVEFPLAKFAEVMSAATIPDNFQEKVAQVTTEELKAELEKEASATDLQLVEAEQLTYLIKSASANKEALERIEMDSIVVADMLVKAAKALGKDDAWMDKLACVTDEKTFSELSILVSGEVKGYRELGELGLFKVAQLKEATGFAELYKQARALVREQRERSELQKRAADAAQGVKSNIFNKAMQGGAKSAMNAAQKANPAYVAGKAIGVAASTPFRAAAAAGKAINNSVKNNIAALGKPTAKNTAKAIGRTSASAVSGVIRAGGPVLDAAFYDPGTDKTTGRSNDVWSALQRD
jgi:hypothetical protein